MDSDVMGSGLPVVQRLIDQALGELEKNNPGQSMQLLIEAKRARIAARDLDYVRALAFLQIGKRGDAREALLEELRQFPDNQPARELLGQILQEERSAPEAPQVAIPHDGEFQDLLAEVRPHSMLPEARLYTLFMLAKQVCSVDLPGDFVECGVAGGGSSALLAKVISRYSRRARKLYACDCFEGMPPPSEHDTLNGVPADATGWGTGTCVAPERLVREVAERLGVADIVEPRKGYFEETLPLLKQQISGVALLHVDCDWYESLLTVFNQLYDKVQPGGVVQVDDYGYWEGVKRALDDFQSRRQIQISMRNIDNMSAWFVKEP